VFVTYATPQGHLLLDRALSLPTEWTNDVTRCKAAGIPAERCFATKPQLAQQMLQRAFDHGVPAAWVTGESVYGDNRSLRLWLEAHCHAHVVAVSGKEYVWRAGPAAAGPNDPGSVGGGGVGAGEGWRRGQRPALVGLAVARPGRAAAAPLAPVAVGALASARPHGADGVRGVCPACDRAGHWRAGGR